MQDVSVLSLMENAWLQRAYGVQVRGNTPVERTILNLSPLCTLPNILIIHRNAHGRFPVLVGSVSAPSPPKLIPDMPGSTKVHINTPYLELNSASSGSNNNYWNTLCDLSLTARADPYSASLATFGPRHNRLISDQLYASVAAH